MSYCVRQAAQTQRSATAACLETSDILATITAHLLLVDVARLQRVCTGVRKAWMHSGHTGMCKLLQCCRPNACSAGQCSQHCIDFHGLSCLTVLKYMLQRRPCMPSVHTIILSCTWIESYDCIPPCYAQLGLRRLVFPSVDMAAMKCRDAMRGLFSTRPTKTLTQLRLPIRCESRAYAPAYVKFVMSGGIGQILQQNAHMRQLQVLDISDSSICGYGWAAPFDLHSIREYIAAFPLHLRLLILDGFCLHKKRGAATTGLGAVYSEAASALGDALCLYIERWSRDNPATNSTLCLSVRRIPELQYAYTQSIGRGASARPAASVDFIGKPIHTLIQQRCQHDHRVCVLV